MKQFILMIITIGITSAAVAGEVSHALIKKILLNDAGNYIGFEIEGHTEVVAQPSCATALYPWVVSTTSDNADMILTMLMAAKLSGEKVRLIGSGLCSISSNKEDVKYIMLTDEDV